MKLDQKKAEELKQRNIDPKKNNFSKVADLKIPDSPPPEKEE